MTSDDARAALRRRELEFFGGIGASLSHEINNVVAIIGELCGLLEDLAVVAGEGGVDPEKYKNTTGRITKQIERGKDYVRQLNRFSHSVDGGATTLDMREALEAVREMSERFARLKRVGLSVQTPEAPVRVESGRFELEHVVFRVIQLGLETAPAGADVSIVLQRESSGARLTVKRSAVEEPSDLSAVLARSLSSELSACGGRLDGECDGSALSFDVVIPGDLTRC